MNLNIVFQLTCVFLVHKLLPEEVHNGHNNQGRYGNHGMVLDNIVGNTHTCKCRIFCKLCCYGNIVTAKRSRHNRCGSGNDCRCGQRRHTGLTQNRIQCRKQDDGKVGSTWNYKRQYISYQEYQWNKDIYRFNFLDWLGKSMNRNLIGTDARHIGGIAAQNQNDEAGSRKCTLELIDYSLQRIQYGKTG